MEYPVVLTPDDNGTLLVSCPDLPEVTTFGEDETDALQRAVDAIEEALAARIARREEIPVPSPAPGRRVAALPALTAAKVELYRTAKAQGVTKAELVRRLGAHGPQVDRIFDLRHASRFDQIDRAFRVMGKRLDISVRDAAA
jgi:antitoxin HicB